MGSTPHGSKIESVERCTQAERIPYEITPITSKGLLEINQESDLAEFVSKEPG